MILSILNYQVGIISSFLLNTEFLWIVTTYMVVNLFKEWKFMIFNGNILFTLLIYNWTICTLTAFKSILTFGFKSMHFFFLNYHAKSMMYHHQISEGKNVCVNMNNAAYVE